VVKCQGRRSLPLNLRTKRLDGHASGLQLLEPMLPQSCNRLAPSILVYIRWLSIRAEVLPFAQCFSGRFFYRRAPRPRKSPLFSALPLSSPTPLCPNLPPRGIIWSRGRRRAIVE
jgi:hypothetical protein